MVTPGVFPKQIASPFGFIPAQPSELQYKGTPDQFPLQFAASGVRVRGGWLKIPVATN